MYHKNVKAINTKKQKQNSIFIAPLKGFLHKPLCRAFTFREINHNLIVCEVAFCKYILRFFSNIKNIQSFLQIYLICKIYQVCDLVNVDQTSLPKTLFCDLPKKKNWFGAMATKCHSPNAFITLLW